MALQMENPAAANCGVPKYDLAGASINLEFIASLPPIQANPKAERKFALGLVARVFWPPVASPPRLSGHQRHQLNTEPASKPVIITVGGYAHRDSGLKLKKGPLSERLGGEYVYGVVLPEQEGRRKVAAREAAARDVAMVGKKKPLDFDDLVFGSLHSSGSAPSPEAFPPRKPTGGAA